MNPRQEKLFKIIVEQYIKAAQPVGSKLIVEKYLSDVSTATIRNDMVELENNGLIMHPHTSAGRIPTEAGYKKYVKDNIDIKSVLDKNDKNFIEKSIKGINSNSSNNENIVKNLAKILAEQSKLSIFIGFSKNSVYYTGLSNLFQQPEFQDMSLICNLTRVVEHLDEVMQDIYQKTQELQIKIGSDNPFAQDCSAIMTKTKNILLGILGPLRMDYQKNIKLINFIKEKI